MKPRSSPEFKPSSRPAEPASLRTPTSRDINPSPHTRWRAVIRVKTASYVGTTTRAAHERHRKDAKSHRDSRRSEIFFTFAVFIVTSALDEMAVRFQFSNVYLVSGLATLGGMMQGFDVASMSAIIGTSQVRSLTNPMLKDVWLTTWTVQNVLQQSIVRFAGRYHCKYGGWLAAGLCRDDSHWRPLWAT